MTASGKGAAPASPGHPGHAPEQAHIAQRASALRRAVVFFAPPAVWTVVLVALSIIAGAQGALSPGVTHPATFGVATSVGGLLFYVFTYVVFGLFFPQWTTRQRRAWAAGVGFVCGPLLGLVFLFATMMLQGGVV